MTKKQLFKALNELCDEMDVQYNTSCGGCCYVTACLAKNLERNNIPFSIIVLHSPCHYFIRVSDRYINRCDYIIRENYKDILHYNSKYLFDKYYNEDWNPSYNKKWNLIVSTRIKALFKKYENSRT